MQKGIIQLAVVPLRELPAHRSQQVSQLLFGEGFTVIETETEWLKIHTETDDYEGFIQKTQCFLMDDAAYEKHSLKTVYLTHNAVTIVQKSAEGSFFYLPAGSRIAGLTDREFEFGDDVFILQNEVTPPTEDLISFAKSYLNTPYLWGGRTHFGIDCSGFTQAAFAQFGFKLKRDAWQQAEQGTVVDFLQAALPGDLAFFDNEEGRIIHVGMMLGNEQIIHASGSVKIDRIDDQGIYSAQQKKYTHRLRIIKRYF